MIEIALYQPEIPPNTGNIIRLCANIGCRLHLIHPMGFVLSDKKVQRAGLDYHDLTYVMEHKNYQEFLVSTGGKQIVPCSTKGKCRYSDFTYSENSILLFGPETKGLPKDILEAVDPNNILYLPMRKLSRSLNLSNAAAIIAYEAWRQLGFPGCI